MLILELFRCHNERIQSDIFCSDIGIRDVDVRCQISLTKRLMSMPTYVDILFLLWAQCAVVACLQCTVDEFTCRLTVYRKYRVVTLQQKLASCQLSRQVRIGVFFVYPVARFGLVASELPTVLFLLTGLVWLLASFLLYCAYLQVWFGCQRASYCTVLIYRLVWWLASFLL